MRLGEKIRREKKLNNLIKVFGFILGGVSGSIAGYQLGTFFRIAPFDNVSLLSLFLSLFFGLIGGIIGFVLILSISI